MKILLIDILLAQLVHANVSKPANTLTLLDYQIKHKVTKTCKNIRTGKSNRNIRLMLLTNILLDQLTKIKLITPKVSHRQIM